jgi:hypothetical protein
MGEGGAVMKIKPIFPATFAVLLPLGVGFSYIFFMMFAGFPDGFTSEQETANLQVLTVFNWFSIALAGWFAVLAILGLTRDIARPFLWGCAAFGTASVIALAIVSYVVTHLMDSAGG